MVELASILLPVARCWLEIQKASIHVYYETHTMLSSFWWQVHSILYGNTPLTKHKRGINEKSFHESYRGKICSHKLCNRVEMGFFYSQKVAGKIKISNIL